jgi:hypothetical protein
METSPLMTSVMRHIAYGVALAAVACAFAGNAAAQTDPATTCTIANLGALDPASFREQCTTGSKTQASRSTVSSRRQRSRASCVVTRVTSDPASWLITCRGLRP